MAATRETVVVPTSEGNKRVFQYARLDDCIFKLPAPETPVDRSAVVSIDSTEIVALTPQESEYLKSQLEAERLELERRAKCLVSDRAIIRFFVTLPTIVAAGSATLLVRDEILDVPQPIETITEISLVGLALAIGIGAEILGKKISDRSAKAREKNYRFLERKLGLVQKYTPSSPVNS